MSWQRLGIVIGIALGGCGGGSTSYQSTPADRAAAERAVAELYAGRFDLARAQAENTLISHRDNSRARAVRAVVRYQAAAAALFDALEQAVEDGDLSGKDGIDDTRIRAALATADTALTEVIADLEVASRDRGFDLELCPACWRRDWNRSGGIDDRDLAMLEVEYDARGTELPRGDPRRRPTFRFDVGDLHWAIAMVSFQRALLGVILGYDWREFQMLVIGTFVGQRPERVTIKVADAAKLRATRQLILAGLDAADRARESYLAETDDDREWVPNPRQQNRGLPLPVDDTLYATWKGVIGDVRGLVAGDTGIAIDELAGLAGESWKEPPGGYLDVSKLLDEPHDITIDLAMVMGTDISSRDRVRGLLRAVFGDAYVDRREPTPLIGRLVRMRGDLDRGSDTFERKLRYFLWLN